MKLTLEPSGFILAIIMLFVVCVLRRQIAGSGKSPLFSVMRPYRQFFNLTVLLVSAIFTIAWIFVNDNLVDSLMMTWYLSYFSGLIFLFNYVFLDR